MPTETNNADLAAILADYVPRSEYEAALAAIDEAVTRADAAETELGTHMTRLKDLEGKVRGRTYRDAFDKVRKDLKVKDEFADDVFRLLGIAQDRDEPDERDMRRAVESFVKDRKHYTGDPTPPKPASLERGEGSTRGPSVRPGDPELRVKYADLNNALFMRDNQARINEASRAGLLVIDD